MAFITGRSEGGREVTARNLQAEGFGAACPRDASGKAQRTNDGPCYVDLHMRNLKGAASGPCKAAAPRKQPRFTCCVFITGLHA